MKRYPMPKEFVAELNENKYVDCATDWTVKFTEEFKRLAYNEYYNGKTMSEIFTEAGFDVEKLGEKRIHNFRNRLMKEASEENGFKDKRKDKKLQAPLSSEAQMAKRIRELEHLNAYLQQENDFLKKIQELETECNGKAAKLK